MRFAVLVSGLVVLFGGCAGYQIGPVKPARFSNVKTIAVNSFKNDTLQPRVEVLLANAVIKQIQQDGTYKVADESAADALLEGTLEEIRRRPSRYVRGNVLQTREYTLQLRARYKVTERATGKVLDERSATGSTSFFVSGSGSIAADVNQDEMQAFPLAAEELAVRLVSQISEGW
jgi:Lipopolysaccharide-assembly